MNYSNAEAYVIKHTTTFGLFVKEGKVVDVPAINKWMIGKSFKYVVEPYLIKQGAKIIKA